jgi:hypothetical protein
MRVMLDAETHPASGSILHLMPRAGHVTWIDTATGLALESAA